MKKTPVSKIAKAIEKKINSPDLSAKDIGEEIGLSERTTSRIIKEELANIGEKSDKVANLIDTNNNLISLADKRLKEYLVDPEKEIKPSDLVSIRESAFKQNQLIQNKPTENISIISDILKDIGDSKPLINEQGNGN